MFLLLMALLIKDGTNVYVPTRIFKGHRNTNICTNLPVCMNGDNPIDIPASENHSISFQVFNPTKYINVECLDQRLDIFHNCSRYNLFVDIFSIHLCGKIRFGYTINLTFAENDFKSFGVLVMLMKNTYGKVNCTFNFYTNDIFGTTSSEMVDNSTNRISNYITQHELQKDGTSFMSFMSTYSVVCGVSALLICVSGCIFKRVRKRSIIL